MPLLILLDPKHARAKRIPVGGYVSWKWEEWLQSNRVELNAMSTPQFLDWLDSKMEEKHSGKLIPPEPVLSEQLNSVVEGRLPQAEIDRMLAEANIDSRVERSYGQLLPCIREREAAVASFVREQLGIQPHLCRKESVAQLAEKIITSG